VALDKDLSVKMPNIKQSAKALPSAMSTLSKENGDRQLDDFLCRVLTWQALDKEIFYFF